MTKLERLTREWNAYTVELQAEYGTFENFVDYHMECMEESEWALLTD